MRSDPEISRDCALHGLGLIPRSAPHIPSSAAMDECQRTYAETAFALSALLAVATFVGCGDAECPSGTKEVQGNCVLSSDETAAVADASTTMSQGPDSPAQQAGGSSAPEVGSAAGSGSAGKGGMGSSPAAAGVAGAPSSNSSGGAAGAPSSNSSGGAAGAPSSNSPGAAAAGSSANDARSGSQADGPCAGHSGEVVCEQATMHHCDSSGGSSSQETCMSSMLCHAGLTSGACAVCNPGTFRCTETKLDRCNDDGQYENVESCSSAALCNESAGKCTDMVCNPNTKSCSSDGTLKTCNADGSAFVGAGEPCGRDMCDARNGRCNHCTPGAKSCRGNSVVACSSDGQAESEETCSASGECWTATCSGSACRESPKSASTRCEGSKYCNGRGDCVACTNDSHCAAMNDDCNDATCVEGICRRMERARGETCRSGSGLCDRGTCHDVECFSASDCTGAGARCTDGECVICGDRKLGPGEQCDIGAPKKSGDQLITATYDEYSCDAQACTRLYIFTPCTVDTVGNSSSECGNTGHCNGQFCNTNAGCNGEGPCRLGNGRSGNCYGNTCFMSCTSSSDCPSNLSCRDGAPVFSGSACS